MLDKDEDQHRGHNFVAVTTGPYAISQTACCTYCGMFVHGQTFTPCSFPRRDPVLIPAVDLRIPRTVKEGP